MKRVKSFSLLAVFFLIFGVAANVSAMAISISDPIITDISASSFSVVWKVNQAASGNVEVYSDAAATTPVALTIEYKSSAHENAEANGVMKVVVKGASAATPYYVKTVTTSKATDEVYTSGVTEATTAMIGDLALERPSIYQIVYKDAAQTQDARGTLLIGRMDSAISPITAWVDFDSGFGVSYGLLQTALFLGSDGKTLETAGKAMSIEAFGGILGKANTDIDAVTTDPNTSQDGGAVSLVATFWTITPTASGTGTVIPAEAVTVFDGASYTITMTPATAGDTVTATDNGATATLTQDGDNYLYTLTAINADHAIEVTFGGGGVVVTPMDIPTAVLAIDAGDTIVDADATAYENEHIANAITADAVSAAPDTRILVYARNVADAQAQAQALVDAGYTNVGYLEVPFADFAADTTNVTDAMVQYKLTVVKEGTGAATATVTPTEGFYKRDEQVMITANPAADSWSTNAPGGVVIMSGAQTVTATFISSACDAVPVITATPRTGAESLTVDFNSVGSTGTNPTWDYGDGPQFQGATATHTYETANTYTVKLTMTGSDGVCTVEVTKDVIVTAPTVCDLTTAVINPVSPGMEPLNATLSATVTGTADTYAWNVTKDGVSVQNGSASTLNLTALAAGTYMANLTVSNSAIANANCSVTAAPVTITVTADNQCDLTAAVINPVSPGMEPLDVTLSATVTGTVDTYAWNVTKDGVSVQTGSASTLNLTALAAGTYMANLTVSNSAIANCSVTAAPVTITVTTKNCDLVSAVINASTYGGKEPLNVALSATVNGTNDTYAWNVTKDGVSFQTGSNATLNLNGLMAGNYTVYLTVSNSAVTNCSVDAGTALIQVSTGDEPDGDGDCNGYVDVYDALLAAQMDACTTNGTFDEACLNSMIAPKTTANLCLDMLDVDQSGIVDINDALAIALYDVGMTCSCVLDQP